VWRERLEWAEVWIAWVRESLEIEFSQLLGGVVSQAVLPLNASTAQWIGAAVAARSGQRLADDQLEEVLSVLEEVERQIAFALFEIGGETA